MAHTADDVIFADYPMFHIAGIFGRGYFAIAHGMSIVIPTPLGARDKRFIDNYWKFVDKFGITIFSGVPTTLAQLAKSSPARREPELAAPVRAAPARPRFRPRSRARSRPRSACACC